jgi:hypothetical protein
MITMHTNMLCKEQKMVGGIVQWSLTWVNPNFVHQLRLLPKWHLDSDTSIVIGMLLSQEMLEHLVSCCSHACAIKQGCSWWTLVPTECTLNCLDSCTCVAAGVSWMGVDQILCIFQGGTTRSQSGSGLLGCLQELKVGMGRTDEVKLLQQTT